MAQRLGCVSLRKSTIGFLNPKESENGFWVSLLNRFFGSWFVEETEESLHSGSGFFRSFDAPRSERSWIDLSSKETQNSSSDFFSLGFKNLILDFLKETHPTSLETKYRRRVGNCISKFYAK